MLDVERDGWAVRRREAGANPVSRNDVAKVRKQVRSERDACREGGSDARLDGSTIAELLHHRAALARSVWPELADPCLAAGMTRFCRRRPAEAQLPESAGTGHADDHGK